MLSRVYTPSLSASMQHHVDSWHIGKSICPPERSLGKKLTQEPRKGGKEGRGTQKEGKTEMVLSLSEYLRADGVAV